MTSSRTLRIMRLTLLALFASSIGLAGGYTASLVLWCVIPPRFPLPWPLSKIATAYRERRRGTDITEDQS